MLLQHPERNLRDGSNRKKNTEIKTTLKAPRYPESCKWKNEPNSVPAAQAVGFVLFQDVEAYAGSLHSTAHAAGPFCLHHCPILQCSIFLQLPGVAATQTPPEPCEPPYHSGPVNYILHTVSLCCLVIQKSSTVQMIVVITTVIATAISPEYKRRQDQIIMTVPLTLQLLSLLLKP